MSQHAIAVIGRACRPPQGTGFDAEFFGLPSDGSLPPDPGQDLLLELLWEAVEDAGFVPAPHALPPADPADPAASARRGPRVVLASAGLGRERLGALGALLPPGTATDGARRSGPAAVQAACRALRRGEADLALAGGRGLGPAGPAGPGAGAVLLKRLDRARLDGDRVLHVLTADTQAALRAALRHMPDLAGEAAVAPAVPPPAPGPASAPAPGEAEARPLPWPISAAGPEALRAQARRLAGHLAAHPGAGPADVGLSLAAGRATHRHRAVVIGADRATLLAGLRAAADGADAPQMVRGAGPAPAEPARVAWVFSGSGGQWHGMGAGLLDASPVFRELTEECARALAPHTGWWLPDVLRGAPGAPALDAEDVIQPAHFALQVALAGTLRAHGLRPHAVVGHCAGEVAAAHVAGALTLADAARVIARWSQAQATVAGQGRMIAVAATEEEVRARLGAAGAAGRLSVGAVNGPASVVVTGDPEAADAFLALARADGLRATPVAADLGAHRPAMDALRERILRDLDGLEPRPGDLPCYVPLAQGPADGGQFTAEHWARMLREPVPFARLTRAVLRDGHTVLLELAPHPVLTPALQETAGAGAAVASSTRAAMAAAASS
ncbi:acyltransferase domain-containing protein [Streptomyces sp. DSM 44917]|uniref:Acyltransferase domain-containing protein n=1 Tax=Streptomyces boetiae TaxID=3075541 RepID=A0ABU2LF63_9ACTN|nr:acyltransferase domain-containing protein [Streptomyces sp. DSM 44917]MDT0309907.1 acyltransferase domain-containing protein [Streptomyces sp. DSM 44917]